MPVAIWCVLAAAFLPILSVFPAKLTRDFSNARPRDPAFWAEGFRARAQGAQANGFEAFPLFAVAVLVAYQQSGDPFWIDVLAAAFIGLRVLYVLCYWMDKATLRSLVWIAATACAVAIFTSPVWS